MNGVSGYSPPANNSRTNNSPYIDADGKVIDAVYEDPNSKQVSVDSFLQLMIAQLKNQDFMNPMDDTQYVTQLAQFATMQQMQDLAYYSQSNYTMSLVGKNVTVAKFGIGGKVEKVIGPVEGLSLLDKTFKIQVKGNTYDLSQIMEIHTNLPTDEEEINCADKVIIPGIVKDTSVDLSWPEASDDPVIASKLKYTLYYSTSAEMNTVEEIRANGTIYGDPEREDLIAETITGLSPDTPYFVNIVVKDTSTGKEYVYSKSAFQTTK